MSKGDKVKVSIRFRGREMAHTDLGLEVQKKFAAALPEAVVEKQPKLEGRSMQMFLAPAPASKLRRNYKIAQDQNTFRCEKTL